MTKEDKIAVFQPYLDKFETDTMRLYCADMIAEIPNYIFIIPSSTSGKYHNALQCQCHGQVYHIIMFAEIMNYRLDLKCNKEKFKSPVQRDAMRCTAFFHDAIKCGWGNGMFTIHEHPILAGQWVRETHVEHDINDKIKEAIARMCERHSGSWTTSNKSNVVLPEPENAMEILVHECDILSSRNNIDMQPPEYLADIFKRIESDETWTMPLGMHTGKTLKDIYSTDPGYLGWAENNIRRQDVVQMTKVFLRKVAED